MSISLEHFIPKHRAGMRDRDALSVDENGALFRVFQPQTKPYFLAASNALDSLKIVAERTFND